MKKVILILVAIIGLTACGTKDNTARIEAESIIEMAKTEALDHSLPHPLEAKIEFKNPALMSGSNFGAFFISMIATQDYERALKFTSKGSREKFDDEKIKEKYALFEYNYKLKLESIKEGDTIILKLSTTEFATGKFKTLKLVCENDTCKLVLQDNLSIFVK